MTTNYESMLYGKLEQSLDIASKALEDAAFCCRRSKDEELRGWALDLLKASMDISRRHEQLRDERLWDKFINGVEQE